MSFRSNTAEWGTLYTYISEVISLNMHFLNNWNLSYPLEVETVPLKYMLSQKRKFSGQCSHTIAMAGAAHEDKRKI